MIGRGGLTMQNRKYFGMTGIQIGILAGLALLVFCLFAIMGYLIFGNGFSLGGPSQGIPTPIPASTLIVVPTITPTPLPTAIPYEQLIPTGWTQYRTTLVEIWLPSAFKVPKSNTSGLPPLAGSELIVSRPAAKASLFALWVIISHEALTSESLDVFLDVKFQSLPSEYRVVDRQTVLVNSVPAERVVVEARVKNVDVNELVYIFQDSGTVWYVLYAAQINDFYENLETFETSARTFRLVK
jgi:hypothetical protein